MTRRTKEALLDPAEQKGQLTCHGYVNIFVGARSMLKQRYLWQMENGPIPAGRQLRCLDGNRANCEPANWELIVRKESGRRRYVAIHLGGGRRVQKHRHVWEQVNGPIPPGMVLRPLSGDCSNADPSNWELVSPGVIIHANNMMAVNKLPEEFRETAVAVAKLQRRVADLEKGRFAPETEARAND